MAPGRYKLQSQVRIISLQPPQLTLTDASATNAPFNLRAVNNSLYFSTSTPLTFATTSSAFLTFNSSTGSTTLLKLDVSGSATSTFNNGLNLAAGCYAVGGTCLSTSGSTNAAGADTQVQFNDGGTAFGGNVNFTFNKTTGIASSTFYNVSRFGGYQLGGTLLAYASSTNNATIFGLSAGGTNATTSATDNITAIGYQAGSTVTGTNNTAIGTQALAGRGNTGAYTGTSNTVIGYQALSILSNGASTVTANNNIVIGDSALSSNVSSAQANVAIGTNALLLGSTASANVVIGHNAGQNINTGNANILIGSNVAATSSTSVGALNIGNVLYGMGLYNNSGSTLSSAATTNGSIGISTSSPYAQLSIHAINGSTKTTLFAIGSSTASATTTLLSINNTGTVNFNLDAGTSTLFTFGSQVFVIASTTGFNTGVGQSALSGLTGGARNTALGYQAGNTFTTGADNVAIGYQALDGSDTGTKNIGIGVSAGNGAGSGDVGNIAIGYQALSSSAGSNNIILGQSGGNNVGNTASNNILIGAFVNAPSATGNQQLNIGNVLFGTNLYNGASASAVPVTNGNIGIGSSSPYAQLSIHGVAGSTNTTLFAISSSTAAFATTTLFQITNTGVASSTALTISGQGAASGNNCLQIDTAGAVTKTGSACGGRIH
jgi:hypothetical protein